MILEGYGDRLIPKRPPGHCQYIRRTTHRWEGRNRRSINTAVQEIALEMGRRRFRSLERQQTLFLFEERNNTITITYTELFSLTSIVGTFLNSVTRNRTREQLEEDN